VQKKLTITIDEMVYNNLHIVVGKGKISKFIENLIKPCIKETHLKLAYQEMNQDKVREKEATEWTEGLTHNEY
jgi:predicted CopG family antitoxin